VPLTKIATCVQQIQPSGAINHPGRTVIALAQIGAAAERSGDTERAALAIASMMLALTYTQVKFGEENPAYGLAVRELGDEPPFYRAGDILESKDWVDRWVNKLPPIPQGVMIPIGWLQQTIEAHAELHGRTPPEPPQEEGSPWYMEGVTADDLAQMLGEDRAPSSPPPRRRNRRKR
jgi:hypothetical protein